MRSAFAILLFVVCCYSFPLKEYEYQSLFAKWTVMHSKNYDVETFFKRYTIFKTNVDYVNNHNAKNASYEMEMNRFGDLTFEEFSANYKGFVPPIATSVTSVEATPLSADPVVGGASLDWRTRNAVNPVQSQGGCGSCWAFSAIAAAEGAWAIKKNSLVKFSEQQIVDCSQAGGCGGGATNGAFAYMVNKGIGALSKYPYVGRDQTCKTNIDIVGKLTKYTEMQPFNSGNEAAMITAVNLGPISISLAASQPFQFYSKGVLDDSSCGNHLDHAVAVVGYGTATDGKDYWIVRNSWGSWGESGYIRIVRNKNMCGLASYPLYPIV